MTKVDKRKQKRKIGDTKTAQVEKNQPPDLDVKISSEFAAVQCCFCGKPGTEVKKLIVSNCASICEECVSLCVDIIREEVDPCFGDSSLFGRRGKNGAMYHRVYDFYLKRLVWISFSEQPPEKQEL